MDNKMTLETYGSLDEKEEFFYYEDWKQINTVEEFDKAYPELGKLGVQPQAEKLHTKNRDWVIFRGMSEAKYKLYTSAQREWLTQDLKKVLGKDGFVDFIESLLVNLRENRVLDDYFEAENFAKSDLLYLSFLQHYGAPTPLLDFTCNKDVALFFATENYIRKYQVRGDIEDYFSIYVFPSDRDLVSYVDQFYNNADNVVSKGQPIRIDWKKKPDSIKGAVLSDIKEFLFYIRNPLRAAEMKERGTQRLYSWSNPNIIAQQGCFILNPLPNEPLEYLCYKNSNGWRKLHIPHMKCFDIHKSLAPYIREKYLKPKGITKETIYPDFKSIANDAYEAFKRNPTAKISPRRFARFKGLTYFRRR